jgi:hypothetical protein
MNYVVSEAHTIFNQDCKKKIGFVCLHRFVVSLKHRQ